MVFIGEGRGESEAEAKNNASRDALEQMGEGLGYDLTQQYLREFLGTGRIEDFGAYVSDTYVSKDDDGYSCLSLVVVPEAGYYSQRSEEYLTMLDRQDTIKKYLAKALEHYRENEDANALNDVLYALSASLDGPVLEDQLRPEVLLGTAVKYLSGMKLQTVRPSGNSRVLVRIKRDRLWFDPRVVNAVVDAKYQMAGIDARLTQSSIECITDSRGQFFFSRTNPAMLRRGTLVFQVQIPEELLSSIERKAEEGFLDEFLALYEASALRYEYFDPPVLTPADVAIAVASFDSEGEPYFQDTVLEMFQQMLSTAGLGYYPVMLAQGGEESELYDSLKTAYPGRRHLFLVRIGISDYRESMGTVYVRSDGYAVEMNGTNDEIVRSVESFSAAPGEDLDSAAEASLAAAAAIAANSMLAWL